MATTNADVIARVLGEAGVEYAYGLPGGEVVVLIDALRRAGIRFLLVGHEASAAFMADVTGQITGRPGVCVSTLGPGAANLVTGIANAYLERSPVLAITAQTPPGLAPSFTHQRLPLDRLFAGITKQTLLLDGVDTGARVEAALRLAAAERPGPVHLALPADAAARPDRPSVAPHAAVGPPASVEAEVAAVEEVIGEAQRPLLLVGLGARPGDAPGIRRLLDAAGWPWMTTPKGKGVVPETHARFLGVASGMAIDRAIVETIEACDLIVGIGFDPVECDKPWFLERRTVNITRWPTAEGAYAPLEGVGDVGAIAADLATRVAPRPWPAALLDERRRAIQRSPGAGRGLSPLAVLRTLREILPEEAVVTVDVGSHKLLAGQFWQTTVPQTFFISNGLSSMGYGLPAAMAAALHLPGRPVAALVGDGGMLMMAHNLPLLASLGLPVLIVVLSDGSLSLIRVAQARRGLPAYGVDFDPPDSTRFAAACGIDASRVTTLEALRQHAGRALSTGAPFLLDVAIDHGEYADLMS